MEYQENYPAPNPLKSIPQKKIDAAIRYILDSYPETKNKSIDESVIPEDCAVQIDAIHRYADANIPVDYWFRDMDNFQGDNTLIKYYKSVTENLQESYFDGVKLCFAGKNGVGKTLTASSILKRVVESGKYTGLYVTLSDIVSVLTSGDRDKREVCRQTLLTIDFLVIDEFDPRFIGTSHAASELYGRILEQNLRTRIHNRLPLFFCTNSPDPLSNFTGPLKQSISSLMNLVKMVPVLGADFRKKNG